MKTIGTKIELYMPKALIGIIGLKKVARKATEVVTEVINMVLAARLTVNANLFLLSLLTNLN